MFFLGKLFEVEIGKLKQCLGVIVNEFFLARACGYACIGKWFEAVDYNNKILNADLRKCIRGPYNIIRFRCCLICMGVIIVTAPILT